MKGVQCYELFGGIALKIHTFSFSFSKNIITVSVKSSNIFALAIGKQWPNMFISISTTIRAIHRTPVVVVPPKSQEKFQVAEKAVC